MVEPKTHLVHTEQGAPIESSSCGGGLGSLEPADRRPLSSVVERRVHIADVVGSTPTAATVAPQPSTSWRGDICEAMAASEFMRLGYGVSRPLSNALPYDLVIDNGSRLYKVQVKSLALRGDILAASLVSSKYHRNQRASQGYAGRIDWFVAVSPELGRCFILEDTAMRSVQMRLAPSRNNQMIGVRWADDYELKIALGPCRGSWAEV